MLTKVLMGVLVGSLVYIIYLNGQNRLLEAKVISHEKTIDVLKVNTLKLTNAINTINLQYKRADEEYNRRLEEYNNGITNVATNNNIDKKRLEAINAIAKGDPKSDPKGNELDKVNNILNEMEFNEDK